MIAVAGTEGNNFQISNLILINILLNHTHTYTILKRKEKATRLRGFAGWTGQGLNVFYKDLEQIVNTDNIMGLKG